MIGFVTKSYIPTDLALILSSSPLKALHAIIIVGGMVDIPLFSNSLFL